MTVRVGVGYDSHRFVAGRPLVLGGLRIAHPFGLAGHSDADAVAHALTDAILGAAGAGNIGQLFPDTDPQWKDADSMELLRTANELVRGRGYAVVQADLTVITEAPKLGPHVGGMGAALAARLGLAPGAVNVKAKTNEGMGFIGRGEGLAVIAVATLEAR
jgi:2-C-methyl-D-erythritol 2,4-cyclodiphosphate synthase